MLGFINDGQKPVKTNESELHRNGSNRTKLPFIYRNNYIFLFKEIYPRSPFIEAFFKRKTGTE